MARSVVLHELATYMPATSYGRRIARDLLVKCVYRTFFSVQYVSLRNRRVPLPSLFGQIECPMYVTIGVVVVHSIREMIVRRVRCPITVSALAGTIAAHTSGSQRRLAIVL